MNYLLIENNGEIDINSLILMGGSTKRGDTNSIGFYGSGNKYSLASLLRNNINFKIFSGDKEIKIHTEKVFFRDVEFDKIFIDRKETSLTVQMGPEWKETWFIIREIASNSMDEGGSNIITNTKNVQGIQGKTRFYIELTSEIQKVVNDWDNYFTWDRIDLIHENNAGKIFPNLESGENIVLFRKGIRAGHYNEKSLYSYDSHLFEINESRVIKCTYTSDRQIADILAQCTDERIIKNVLKNATTEKYKESKVWHSSAIDVLNPKWEKAIGSHRLIVSELGGWFEAEAKKYDCYYVCDALCKKIKQRFPNVIIYGLLDSGENMIMKKKATLSDREKYLLKECNDFFNECNYKVEYPIDIVEFEESDQLGLAENGTIYLSNKLFNMGKREIAVTIVEENEHLKTKYKDCSRAFQQHFINLFISQMEEKNCMFL